MPATAFIEFPLIADFCYNRDMDINELQSLPVDQKLAIIGQLWDDIGDSNAPIVLSPSVIAEVDRRRAESTADPSTLVDRKEMWTRANQARRDNG